MADRSQSESALVQFSERLTNSAAFGVLFREGMDLVEETAAYLDGDGRSEAKALERSVSLTYATESMRLTTRLMQPRPIGKRPRSSSRPPIPGLRT